MPQEPAGTGIDPVAGRNGLGHRFRRFAAQASSMLGSPWAFFIACVLVATWAVTGPWFGYSDTWQLVINTSTTIGTFLMVFLLQSTQNRDTKSINIKLDELLRAIEGARTGLADLSELSDEEIEHLESELVALARKSGVDELPASPEIVHAAQRVARAAEGQGGEPSASGAGRGTRAAR